MNGNNAEDKLQQCEREMAHLRQQNAELAAELESLGYSISHDLRAPLRAVSGFARALGEDYSDKLDSEAKRYLQIIMSGSSQMSQMIDALLALSRLGRQPLKCSSIDVDALVRSIVTELQAKLPEREIRFEISSLPNCDADLTLIRSVWSHLIANAIKFTASNPQAAVTITGENRDADILYRIRDNGVGFDMNYATKLFGLFQRFHTDKEFPGVGAGLAVVQRLVRRHGGNVWAESAVDQGATFLFTLPKQCPDQM
jgi:light-regulated signal transduction histidine kinase (bacteriophytochrome)